MKVHVHVPLVALLCTAWAGATEENAGAESLSNATRNFRRVVSTDVYTGKARYALDEVCTGLNGTCAMKECQTRDTAPACEFTPPKFNAQASMAKYKCQSCYQANDTRCSRSFLNSVLKKNGGIVAAYCNDRNLVILTSGAPSHTPDLDNVVFPPSATFSGKRCVTRTWWKEWRHYKIPVNGTYELLPTADRSNNANKASFPEGAGDSFSMGSTGRWKKYLYHPDRGAYGLPMAGATGVTTAGQEVLPIFSNQVVLTPQSCEVDSCNEHVGQIGGAPHLHGDPFSKTGRCLYSPSDYSSIDAHPPIVGFALDGPTIYGRYLSAKAPGFGTLDACGGHVHKDYDYHYHAAVKSGAATGNNQAKAAAGTEFPAFPFGPDQCYKVNISKIVGFWSGTQRTVEAESDEYTRPCCGMKEYYANGVTIDGAFGTPGHTEAPTTTPITTTTPPSTPAPTPAPVGRPSYCQESCKKTTGKCYETCGCIRSITGSCLDGEISGALMAAVSPILTCSAIAFLILPGCLW